MGLKPGVPAPLAGPGGKNGVVLEVAGTVLIEAGTDVGLKAEASDPTNR